MANGGYAQIYRGGDRNSGCIGVTKGDSLIKGQSSWPLTIKYLGYESLTTSATDTIKLVPATYELKEVVVSPIDRPIKRVLCFVREYSSGIAAADTMQIYSEYMAEAYIADGKVKGYKKQDAKLKTKVSKHYARKMKNGSDKDSVNYNEDNNLVLFSLIDKVSMFPEIKTDMPDAIKAGATADTVQGKSGPLYVYKKKNDLFTITTDVLSNYKDRKWTPLIFKMLGMTVDIVDLNYISTFTDNGSDTFGINDYVLGAFNIKIIGRGKLFKKALNTTDPIEMNLYTEIYPVDITNCTVEEYKELREK